jgi:geranylgeranyl pyrophosphate synthase
MEEFKHSQTKINNILSKFIELKSESLSNSLKEMLVYAIEGGKRLRPIIALSISNFIISSRSSNMDISKTSLIIEEQDMLNSIAIFVELLHGASLILDDLPCMDNDSMRRGKPTFHIKYGVKNAFVVSNFMISHASGVLMKQIVTNKELHSNMVHLMIKEMYDNNLLTSLGQIIDLQNYQTIGTNFITKMQLKISTNLFFGEMITKYCEKHNMRKDITIKNLLWLNMKTFPLFYLSFLLPYLAFAKSDNIYSNTLFKIEYLAICFSIMFQMSDDFEDFEKDKLTNKIDSHLKILKFYQLKDLYKICKTDFLNLTKEIFSFNKKPPNLFLHFVELLNKKIELYDNGADFE